MIRQKNRPAIDKPTSFIPQCTWTDPLNLHKHDIRHFIRVETIQPDDVTWSTPSPFNLRFKREVAVGAEQNKVLKGAGIYLISLDGQVAYLGKYQPANGDIISDRWGRHLQTITARGRDIGFGGARSPERRLGVLLGAIEHPGLRSAVHEAHKHEAAARFRDTGYNTSSNRLRFASEHWDFFAHASPTELLERIAFTVLPVPAGLSETGAREAVTRIEKCVLQIVKPCCNREYHHKAHGEARHGHALDLMVEQVARAFDYVLKQQPKGQVRLCRA